MSIGRGKDEEALEDEVEVWQVEEEEEGEEGRSKQARSRMRRVRSASRWRSNGDGEKLSRSGWCPTTTTGQQQH